jgi:tRNA (guanine-N7-)-methyltransferase
MSFGDSKAIVTNQTGIHDNLADVVRKHLAHASQKPYQAHTQQAFDEINAVVQNFNGEIILDSCCGVGQSTRILAQRHPQALVIGVDKSLNRINRNVDDHGQGDNYHLIRADLNDFFRLVRAAKWPVSKHYVLYPNPWPKSKHLKRRWHGSAVFPDLMAIGEQLILRSNWRLYLEEFEQAASMLGYRSALALVDDVAPLTPFEAKYLASAQQCWQLDIKPGTG